MESRKPRWNGEDKTSMTDYPEMGNQKGLESDDLSFASLSDGSVTSPESMMEPDGAADSGTVENLKDSKADSDAGSNSKGDEPQRRRVRRRMSAEHIRRIKKKRRAKRILIVLLVVLLGICCHCRNVCMLGVEDEERTAASRDKCERPAGHYCPSR